MNKNKVIIKHGLHFRDNLAGELNINIKYINNLKKIKSESSSNNTKSLNKSKKIDKIIKTTKRALLIGCNYKGSKNELQGCINDVYSIKTMLKEHFSFNDNNIILLTDDGNNIMANRKNIIKYIKYVVSLSNSSDELFIHYSGHGTQIPCYLGDEINNKTSPNMDDAIVPTDFDLYNKNSGLITDDELKTITVNKLPLGTKLRVFLDCCFSGSGLDLPYLYLSKNKYENDNTSITLNTNCLLISGCKDNQYSADAYIGNKFTGALTWALIEAINKNLHKNTSWINFLLEVRSLLIKSKYEQIPMLTLGDKNLGNIILDL